MLVKILIGWGIFVALVYLLMWIDHITHKRSLIDAFHAFIESFGEE